MFFPVISPNRWAMALICGTLVCAACSHKLAPDGHYQDTPVVADGSTDDWSLPLRFSNPDYTLQYSVTNDNKYVYICVLSKDDATQLRMLRAGMNIYLDPKGEKNKDYSIAYPIRKQPDPENNYRNRNNTATAADLKTRKEQLLVQSDYYNTRGFLNMENGQYNLFDKKKSELQLAMKFNNDDSVLVYEAIVPIRDILGAELTPHSDLKNFSVGIMLNAPARAGGTNSSRPYGGGGGGMRGGGMRGMGMGGGRGGYNSGAPTAKEETNWYQFHLVTKKG